MATATAAAQRATLGSAMWLLGSNFARNSSRSEMLLPLLLLLIMH